MYASCAQDFSKTISLRHKIQANNNKEMWYLETIHQLKILTTIKNSK